MGARLFVLTSGIKSYSVSASEGNCLFAVSGVNGLSIIDEPKIGACALDVGCCVDERLDRISETGCSQALFSVMTSETEHIVLSDGKHSVFEETFEISLYNPGTASFFDDE